jgi:hypothetical protein
MGKTEVKWKCDHIGGGLKFLLIARVNIEFGDNESIQ